MSVSWLLGNEKLKTWILDFSQFGILRISRWSGRRFLPCTFENKLYTLKVQCLSSDPFFIINSIIILRLARRYDNGFWKYLTAPILPRCRTVYIGNGGSCTGIWWGPVWGNDVRLDTVWPLLDASRSTSRSQPPPLSSFPLDSVKPDSTIS